jgi:hypothetical protein
MNQSRILEWEEFAKRWGNRKPISFFRWVAEDKGGRLKLLEKTKPVIKICGFEEVDLIDCMTSPTLRRQILDRLQV